VSVCSVKAVNHDIPETDPIAQDYDVLSFYCSLVSSLCMVTAAASCGLTNSVLKKALKYTAVRYQAGKMIIEHSHIRNILGRMRLYATASWGAVSYLAA